MSSKGVDIKYKCHNSKSSKSKCACQDDELIEVKGETLKYTDGQKTDYKYCIHRDKALLPPITDLYYGGNRLKIENGGGEQSRQFSDEHPKVWEVITYYHKEHDKNAHVIKVPLALRVRTKISEYNTDKVTLYENTGNNITWRKISDQEEFPENDTEIANDDFIQRLKYLTCDLHKLHFVDIYAKSSYGCACGRANVTVIPDGGATVPGYTKYDYKYRTDKNSVRYKEITLEDEYGEPFPLTIEHTPNLTVYYWEKDKDRRKKPLLMEVYVEGFDSTPVLVCNVGTKDNSKWNMLALSPDELKEKLHEQKCRLFRPVVINTSQIGTYDNTYCEEEGFGKKKCPNGVNPGEVTVENYNGHIPEGYTAKKHTYENGKQGDNKTFTITEFIGGPSEGRGLDKLPIFDVTEVVVFFPERDDKPFLVYVSSDGGRTKKWYSRAYNGNKLEEIGSKLGNEYIQKAYSHFLNVTREIIKRLGHSEGYGELEPGSDEEEEEYEASAGKDGEAISAQEKPQGSSNASAHSEALKDIGKSPESPTGAIGSVSSSDIRGRSAGDPPRVEVAPPVALGIDEVEALALGRAETVVKGAGTTLSPESTAISATIIDPRTRNNSHSKDSHEDPTQQTVDPSPQSTSTCRISAKGALVIGTGKECIGLLAASAEPGLAGLPGPSSEPGKEPASGLSVSTSEPKGAGTNGHVGNEGPINTAAGEPDSGPPAAQSPFQSQGENAHSTDADSQGGTHLITLLGDIIGKTLSGVNNVVNGPKFSQNLADIGKAGSDLASTIGTGALNAAIKLVNDFDSANKSATARTGSSPSGTSPGGSTAPLLAEIPAAYGATGSDPPQGTHGPDSSPAPSNKGSNPPIKTISISVSSVLGTSALACFAGWKLYNRYKGDPWIIHGYSIVFKECTMLNLHILFSGLLLHR